MTGLKLRDDAYYVPTGEGILIVTAAGRVVLTGRSIYQWVDRLAPHLDGRRTLAELTAALPADRKQMTERIIATLRDRGVVVDTADGTGPERQLTDGERRLYDREIGFLGYFGASGERAFQAYRDSAVVVVGAGQLLAETVRAALSSGSGLLHVAVTDHCPTDLGVLAEYERRARQRDPQQRFSRSTAGSADGDRLPDLAAGADIVVCACDWGGLDLAQALDQACARAGVPLVSAMLAGDQAWLGPFGQRPAGPGAWRRLRALEGGAAGSSSPGADQRGLRAAGGGIAEPPAGQLAGAVATVVANQLVREVVRLLSGTAAPSGPDRMTRVDLRSLRTESHLFLPHPFSLAVSGCDLADQSASIARLRGGEPVDPEEFTERMEACLQARLGVLSDVTERDLAQIPLAVAQARVSDPVLLLGPGAPLPVVTGAGLSLTEARRAAVLRGLAAYGSLMVDPRRLHASGDPRDITADPDEELAALRAGHWSAIVWGHGLADGRPRALAAEAVFPALRDLRPGYSPPPGAAAGYSWDEAVRAGLVSQCLRLTLAQLDAGRRFRPISWDDAALDARGCRYRSMAAAIGGRLQVYDVTGALRVPTLAFCVDDATVAYASGFSFGDALRDGLADVLLAWQAQADGEADYAQVSVPALPEHGRLPGLFACPTWGTDAAAVAAGLVRLGWDAVAVPLDHDPEVTGSILPYLVNVVVARG